MKATTQARAPAQKAREPRQTGQEAPQTAAAVQTPTPGASGLLAALPDPGPKPKCPTPPGDLAILHRLYQTATQADLGGSMEQKRAQLLGVPTINHGAQASIYRAELLQWVDDVQAWETKLGV